MRRSPRSKGLSSQPTLSRFENALDGRSLKRLRAQLEQSYVDALPADTEAVVLDIDTTDDALMHAARSARSVVRSSIRYGCACSRSPPMSLRLSRRILVRLPAAFPFARAFAAVAHDFAPPSSA